MVSILGTGTSQVILAIIVPMVPRAARVCRANALAIREMAYVEAARAGGLGHRRIILRHVVPNVRAPYLIMLTAFLGQAILLEASLSFLGLFPGLAISPVVFAFSLFGDSLRDALGPRLRAP